MKTLQNIQQAVKDITHDDKVVLTVGFGLKMFNRTYRSMCNMFGFPELIRVAVLTSKTVANQESYEWTGEDFPVFSDVKFVEIEAVSDDYSTTESQIFNSSILTAATTRYVYKKILPAPNEYEWVKAGQRAAQTVPQYYKRYMSNRHYIVAADVGTGSNRWHSVSDGTTWVQTTTANIGDEVRYYAATASIGTGASTSTDTNRVAFRPAPSTASRTIRVVGVTEPDEISTSSTATVFLQRSADDALEHLLSASWLFRMGAGDKASIEIERATSILQSIFINETVTTEKIKGLA